MSKLRRRRSPSCILCAGAAAVVATACAAPAASPPRHKGGDGPFRVVIPFEPRTFNPNLAYDEMALVVGQNIFNKLVSLTADGSLVPELAERWDESADGLTYTFHIRRGVTWHDGRPFTAEDVRQTLVRAREESVNEAVASHIADVKATGGGTVAVTLTEPWAAFIPTLASFGTSILPAHVYGTSRWTDHPANGAPVGTGPFRFKSWAPGERIILEKNPDYFGPGPYVDSIEFIIAPENGVQRIVDGSAHLMIGRAPTERIHELSQTEGVRVLMGPGEGRVYVGFNMRRAPWNDVRARRAVNMAIDRSVLVERALSGIGMPAVGFYTPSVSWAYNGAARIPDYDVAGARRLIAAAVPSSYVGRLSAPRGLRSVAEEIVRQMAAAGLRLRAEIEDSSQRYIDRLLKDRDFDLGLLSGTHGPDPDNLAMRFASEGALQFMGYSNPAVDAALAEGARSLDMVDRARAYHRVQELIAADLPVAPLTEGVRVTVFRAGVRGLPQGDARSLAADFTYNLVRIGTPPGR